VLPEVKAYHDDIGVPFGHWQFDSWFYPKVEPASLTALSRLSHGSLTALSRLSHGSLTAL
jgi:hypothetical protein